MFFTLFSLHCPVYSFQYTSHFAPSHGLFLFLLSSSYKFEDFAVDDDDDVHDDSDQDPSWVHLAFSVFASRSSSYFLPDIFSFHQFVAKAMLNLFLISLLSPTSPTSSYFLITSPSSVSFFCRTLRRVLQVVSELPRKISQKVLPLRIWVMLARRMSGKRRTGEVCVVCSTSLCICLYLCAKTGA